MALTWELKDCPAWNATYLRDENGEIVVDEEGERQFIDEVASDRMWHNIQQIGFALMNLGFPKGPWQITEKNWHEVFCRIYMNEKVHGAFRCNVDGPVYFEPGDVHELIGATLNVGNRTDAQANAFITRIMRSNAEQKIYRWEKEQANRKSEKNHSFAVRNRRFSFINWIMSFISPKEKHRAMKSRRSSGSRIGLGWRKSRSGN